MFFCEDLLLPALCLKTTTNSSLGPPVLYFFNLLMAICTLYFSNTALFFAQVLAEYTSHSTMSGGCQKEKKNKERHMWNLFIWGMVISFKIIRMGVGCKSELGTSLALEKLTSRSSRTVSSKLFSSCHSIKKNEYAGPITAYYKLCMLYCSNFWIL